MQRIRIGNDLSVSIFIYNNGAIYDLTGKTVKLYLVSPVSKTLITPTINSNNISFVFPGSDQKVCGKYNVEIEIASGSNKNTLDSCEGFKLVDRSCKIGGDDGEFIVNSIQLYFET